MKTTAKYLLPLCLVGKCDPQKYSKWLHRKANAHVRRDRRRRGHANCTVAEYKAAIHEAVTSGGDRDFYTGEELDWSLISTFDNKTAKAGRSIYKKTLWMLPTVDHIRDECTAQKFVICSWKTNDAKSDLSLEDFHALCETVLRHRDRKQSV